MTGEKYHTKRLPDNKKENDKMVSFSDVNALILESGSAKIKLSKTEKTITVQAGRWAILLHNRLCDCSDHTTLEIAELKG